VYSTNSGTNWSLSNNQAAFTICSGGSFDRASDPVVAWSSDGNTVYQSGLAFDANGPAFGGASSVQVSTSGDGGKMWGSPVVVRQDNSTTVLNDKDWITADPTTASDAYLVWDRLVSPSTNANPDAFTHSPAFRGPALFSKTTDSGAHWSRAQIIYDPGQLNQTIDNEIVAIPAAGSSPETLIDGFVQIQNKPFKPGHNPYSVDVIRSTDGGATWSKPTLVSSLDVVEVSSLNGKPYRTGDMIPQFTRNPSNGDLYAVWQDGSFSSGLAKVAFSQSTDGGAHWSAPIEIDDAHPNAAAFTPQITVNSAGTIGVSYYDNENASVKQPGNTDEFIVSCTPSATSDDCGSRTDWTAGGETLLSTSGSFDMLTAPFAEGGHFVGDYEGMGASGTTFDPFFVMAKPIATACGASSPDGACTDPFFNTAH